MTSPNLVEDSILRGDITDDAAEEILAALRWVENEGRPICPRCSSKKLYRLERRRRFKCVSCGCQYSVTTDTIFSGHKLPYSKCLQAMLMYERSHETIKNIDFVCALGVSYKTASVMRRKLWEAYCLPGGPLSGPSYLMRGYWQSFNTWRVDENGGVIRENAKGERRYA